MTSPFHRSSISAIALGLALATTAAPAQQGARATLIPQSSRQPAPPLQLADPAGTSKPIEDYRGKVVLLNFWATACGGCQIEIPWLIELAAAHKSDSVTVLGISMDTSYEGAQSPGQAWARVKPFVASHNLNYPVLLGDANLITTYSLKAVPASYLLDKQGRIAATYPGLIDKQDVAANLAKLLAEQ